VNPTEIRQGDKTMRGTLGIALCGLALTVSGSAQAAPPAAAVVERDGNGALVVRWRDTNPVDVVVSDKPDTATSSATPVSLKDADGQATLADTEPARRYFLLRDTKSGQVARTAERVLPLERGSNFRDLGGYPAARGRHVRWGAIYRSGATPLLNDADVTQVKALHLAAIVDLRSSEERVMAPTRITGVRYLAIDYPMMAMMGRDMATTPGEMPTLYRRMPSFLTPHLKIVFDELLAGKGPVMFHCSAGQDRTGVTAAIVLSALGVPRDKIIEDYHLSTVWRRPEFEMPRIDPALAETNPVARMFAGYQGSSASRQPTPLKTADGHAFLEGALAEIDARWGSVHGFLKAELGLTEREIRHLQASLTE